MSDLVLFDTTAYVQAFRLRRTLPDIIDMDGALAVHFSSVVGEELYIGASTPDQRRRVDRLWLIAEELGRMVTPSKQHWREAGLVLQQVRARYGSDRVAQGRMTNDALIALSARDGKIAILTADQRDFAVLGEFLTFDFRPFDLNAT